MEKIDKNCEKNKTFSKQRFSACSFLFFAIIQREKIVGL